MASLLTKSAIQHAAVRPAQPVWLTWAWWLLRVVVEAGIAMAPDARLAFLTPSHQFPLSVALSMGRRLELVAWARAAGAWILEDDYAAEFRYAGAPLPALQGLGGGDRVIYVGTLNKALFPGLRLGYVVAPRELVGPLTAMRRMVDRQPPTLTQAIALDFMESGQFAAHIRRRRIAYKAQRDALAAALGRRLGEVLEVDVPDQGMHLIAYFRDGRSDVDVEARPAAERHGCSGNGVGQGGRVQCERYVVCDGGPGILAKGVPEDEDGPRHAEVPQRQRLLCPDDGEAPDPGPFERRRHPRHARAVGVRLHHGDKLRPFADECAQRGHVRSRQHHHEADDVQDPDDRDQGQGGGAGVALGDLAVWKFVAVVDEVLQRPPEGDRRPPAPTPCASGSGEGRRATDRRCRRRRSCSKRRSIHQRSRAGCIHDAQR